MLLLICELTICAADVVVIGAGIAGLSCAYNLAKEGGQALLFALVRNGLQPRLLLRSRSAALVYDARAFTSARTGWHLHRCLSAGAHLPSVVAAKVAAQAQAACAPVFSSNSQ